LFCATGHNFVQQAGEIYCIQSRYKSNSYEKDISSVRWTQVLSKHDGICHLPCTTISCILSGIFLTEDTRLNFAIYKTVIEHSRSGESILDEIDKDDEEDIQKSARIFESKCQQANISYSVHIDKKNAVNDLMHETMFADLLVMDANETFSYLEKSIPGGFVKTILCNSSCPVIAVPEKFTAIKEIALLYDGSASSVHSIKMFDYTLPGMKKMKTKLYYAIGEKGFSYLPDNKLLKEWMKNHYPKAQYKIMEGNEKEIILTLAAKNPGVLIVTGAYNRSNISMWFHKSFADQLMNQIKAPVFLAHL
jgi:hypothetical protein